MIQTRPLRETTSILHIFTRPPPSDYTHAFPCFVINAFCTPRPLRHVGTMNADGSLDMVSLLPVFSVPAGMNETATIESPAMDK